MQLGCKYVLSFPSNILFSDEANFYMSHGVNRQNITQQSARTPHWFELFKDKGSERLMVWHGIFNVKFVGPLFLKGNSNRRAVSSNATGQSGASSTNKIRCGFRKVAHHPIAQCLWGTSSMNNFQSIDWPKRTD